MSQEVDLRKLKDLEDTMRLKNKQIHQLLEDIEQLEQENGQMQEKVADSKLFGLKKRKIQRFKTLKTKQKLRSKVSKVHLCSSPGVGPERRPLRGDPPDQHHHCRVLGRQGWAGGLQGARGYSHSGRVLLLLLLLLFILLLLLLLFILLLLLLLFILLLLLLLLPRLLLLLPKRTDSNLSPRTTRVSN